MADDKQASLLVEGKERPSSRQEMRHTVTLKDILPVCK
jgi:hypothetical protein